MRIFKKHPSSLIPCLIPVMLIIYILHYLFKEGVGQVTLLNLTFMTPIVIFSLWLGLSTYKNFKHRIISTDAGITIEDFSLNIIPWKDITEISYVETPGEYGREYRLTIKFLNNTKYFNALEMACYPSAVPICLINDYDVSPEDLVSHLQSTLKKHTPLAGAQPRKPYQSLVL